MNSKQPDSVCAMLDSTESTEIQGEWNQDWSFEGSVEEVDELHREGDEPRKGKASMENTLPRPQSPTANGHESFRRSPSQQALTTSFVTLQTAVTTFQVAKERAWESTKSVVQVAKQYMIKYPSLKLFVYSAGALSVFPIVLGIFLFQSAVILVGMAETGVLFLAGGIAGVCNVLGVTAIDLPKPKTLQHYQSLLLQDLDNPDIPVDDMTTIIH
ncbi:hypothetical protein HDV03_000372 [Kappamyces sp. JEL0829]|nr:hypothetical protein HDV03_000372 [Kappamyces sp. JEL0829]